MKANKLVRVFTVVVSTLWALTASANHFEGIVWYDSNCNGVLDGGEVGVGNVNVEARRCSDNALIGSTVTKPDGTFIFYDGNFPPNEPFVPKPGTYRICFNNLPAGFTFSPQVTPQPGQTNSTVGPDGCTPCFNFDSEDNSTLNNAGLCQPSPCTGQIGDFVWNDLNGNGCQDAGEPGIQGVIVDLYKDCANPVLIQTTTTDANGKYLFTGLCAGTYSVHFHTPSGSVHTLPHQSCNVGGLPSDQTDSNCDCTGADDCDVCVTLPADNSQDLSIDCGYLGQQPCLTLQKTAASPTAVAGAQMAYTYVINNCGGTPFSNLAIIDDAGTPDFPGDDFTVASGISLNPGETKTFTAIVYLPTPLCLSGSTGSSSAGTLIVQVLPSGDIQATLRQSRNLNDNVYGTPAAADGWSNGHTFGNLTGSDKAEFRFTDSNGKVVLDFFSDYVSAVTRSATFPSGYASLGPNGGDGSMVTGSKTNVLSYTSTLADSLNATGPFTAASPYSLYTVNSPTPESSFPTWDYVDGYTVVVSKNAFGTAGFGGVTIPQIHNSPAKTGSNQVFPTNYCGCIVNTANVVPVNGTVVGAVLATDTAEVCLSSSSSPPPACMITPGALKIDKNTIQLPIKNNGAADISLTELDLTWNQAVNGKLTKISLNGDVWAGLAASPVALTTVNFNAFNTDPNRRKILKGQTKTLVLQFEKNASKVLTDYSGGTAKFGTDFTCGVTFFP